MRRFATPPVRGAAFDDGPHIASDLREAHEQSGSHGHSTPRDCLRRSVEVLDETRVPLKRC